MTSMSMTEQEIADRLRGLVADLAGVDRREVALDASFRHDLGFDSIDDVEFVMQVEECFDIELGDEQVTDVKSVRDALVLVESALKG